MSLYELFLCGAVTPEQLVQDVKAKTRWAAQPVKPGDSIGAQILRASRELRLDYAFTRRMWYGYGVGPITYPTLNNAWVDLVERRRASAEILPFPLADLPERIEPSPLRRPHKSYRRAG